jgi:ribonuclease BN (tRNA processing enzyme)
MELTVLGGSAAAPNGGDASAGYLIRSGETAILLDCGSGVVSQLRARFEARGLTAVVISHLHSDHTLDLIALRYTLKYAPPGHGAPIPLHLPPGGADFADRLGAVFAVGDEAGKEFWGDVLTPTEYGPQLDADAPLAIGALTLRFAPMHHYIPVWAIRIEDHVSGRVLTYSADTGPASTLADFAAGSDLLLCEATLLEQAPGSDPAHWGHLTAAQAGEIATIAGVKHLVLTHLWAELGFDHYLAAARATFAGPIDTARAGLTLTVE